MQDQKPLSSMFKAQRGVSLIVVMLMIRPQGLFASKVRR